MSGRWAIPSDWTWARADEIADVVGGGTPSSKDESNFDDNGIPWLTPADLTGFSDVHISRGRRSLSTRGLRTSAATIMPAGTVLLSSRAPIGYCAIAATEISTNQGFKSFVPRGAVLPEFLRFYLLWSREYLENLASGTTFLELSGSRAKEIPVPVAPLAEQRRIVAKLDALSARSKRARAELARVEALAERARQAVLSRFILPKAAADWPQVRIGDVAEVVTGGTPAAAEKEEALGGSLPFFKPSDLDAGYDVHLAREYLSEFGAAKARIVPAMSVLVTCIGATIGKVGLTRVQCSTNQQINAIVCKPIVDARWLYWRISAIDFRDQLIGASSATTLPIINKSRFSSLVFSLPPIAVQMDVVREIESSMIRISLIFDETLKALRLLTRLDQSILARAFRGELVPQDPADEPASVLLDRIREDAGSRAPRRRRRAG